MKAPSKKDAHVAQPSAEGRHAQAIDTSVKRILRQAMSDPRRCMQGKSLALGGYTRTGKSLLAERFGTISGFVHVRGDEFRKLFWGIEDDALRDRTRRQAYTQLFRAMPDGLVVETDDFISANRHKRRGLTPLALDILALLRDAGLADVALVLPRQTGVDSRLAALQRWRRTGKCWTLQTHRSEEALRTMVQKMVARETELRDLARAASIDMLEIDIVDFDASIEALSAALARSRRKDEEARP